MSPLTMSYFTCWAFFDACVEPTDETIGTTVLEVGAAFGMHTELLRLIRLMQESRMGLYVHEGAEGDLIILRELATAAVCHAIVPSGYRGQTGRALVRPGAPLTDPRWLGARRLHDAVRPAGARRYPSGRRTSAERCPMPRSKRASTPTSAT